MIAATWRVAVLLPVVELARRVLPLPAAIRWARRGARVGAVCDEDAVPAVVQAVSRWDARWPGGPNCQRRVLLRLLVDPTVRHERVGLGVRRGAAPRSGHVWVGAKDTDETYDLETYLDA